jgi:ankyrin repeat protein
MRKTLRVNAVGALVLTALFWALPPDAPVADAAMRGDLEAIRTLVRQGADVNAAQGDGMTALHWAAMNGSAEMAELLLHAGASVHSVTRLGTYTPLHLAAKEGHAAVVQSLLTGGADPKAVTSTGGATALHMAAQNGDMATVSALISGGADVNAREKTWGHTPLMFAALFNRAPAIKVLMERGSDPAITGSTIDMVQRAKDDEVAQTKRNQLMEALRRKDGTAPPQAPPQAPAAQQALPPAANPLRAAAAAASGSQPRVAGGIRVAENIGREAQIGKYGGKTALGLAARDGNLDAVIALLDGGADVNQKDAADNSSALLVASINGQFDVAKLLIERGADVNSASDSNNQPLFSAINAQWTPKSRHPEPLDYAQQQTTYMELIELMIAKGADVNARLNYDLWFIELGSGYLTLDWTGATPFFRATHALDLPLMKLLVQHGADATLGTVKTAATRAGRAGPGVDPSGLPQVENGQTAVYPIHVASGHAYGDQFVANVHRFVEGEWLNVVKYLVEEHGADVNSRDFAAETPIHNAAARGDNALIMYLVSKGGDVLAVDRKGRSTVDMANGPQQRVQPIPETIKLLESMGAKNNNNCVSC